MIVYLNGAYLSHMDATISPNDRGFLFADGVYEVVCGYYGCLFQADAHWKRLERCLSELRLHVSSDDDTDTDFAAVAHQLLEKNNLQQEPVAVVYMQVTRGAPATRQHHFPPPASMTKATIYAYAKPLQNHADIVQLQQTGCRVATRPDLRWMRCDLKTISLLPNVLAKQEAHERYHAYEAVLVRESIVIGDNDIVKRSIITEGSSTGFALVTADNTLVTAPLKDNLVLPSITRQVVLDLCKNFLNIVVVEEYLTIHELPNIREAMIFSTTAGIMPVIEIDGHAVGKGVAGPITRRIQAAFRDKVQQECGISKEVNRSCCVS